MGKTRKRKVEEKNDQTSINQTDAVLEVTENLNASNSNHKQKAAKVAKTIRKHKSDEENDHSQGSSVNSAGKQKDKFVFEEDDNVVEMQVEMNEFQSDHSEGEL